MVDDEEEEAVVVDSSIYYASTEEFSDVFRRRGKVGTCARTCFKLLSRSPRLLISDKDRGSESKSARHRSV